MEIENNFECDIENILNTAYEALRSKCCAL